MEEYGEFYEEPVTGEWTEAGTGDWEEPAETEGWEGPAGTEGTEGEGSVQEELLEKLGELVEALAPEEGTEPPGTGENPEGDAEPLPDGTGQEILEILRGIQEENTAFGTDSAVYQEAVLGYCEAMQETAAETSAYGISLLISLVFINSCITGILLAKDVWWRIR